MSRRLVKIAKELNVGTGSLVDHLQKNGFEIENKPTAQVSDEMYEVLLKEFQNSMAVKEQADQLIIGTRPAKEDKLESAKGSSSSAKTPLPPLVPKKKPVEVPAPVEEKAEVMDLREDSKPQIKVVGKIDLEQKKKVEPPKEEKKEEVKVVEVPEQVVEEQPEIEEAMPPEEVEVAPEEVQAKEETIRAEAPQLKGLKILGKIDTKKFDKPKKKKEAPAPKPTPAKVSKPSSANDDEQKKKRRRRTKVKQASKPADDQRDRRGKKAEEVKEVSQKEIDDKIKATMARIRR